MEALDDLINERGFKQGQSVKLNYNDIVELINQKVIEELERQMEFAEVGNSYTRLRERIKELKQ
tara:strand:- start:71 stop:262 length:192 start_codon:yes stop_codon:yes gene_type:complete